MSDGASGYDNNNDELVCVKCDESEGAEAAKLIKKLISKSRDA